MNIEHNDIRDEIISNFRDSLSLLQEKQKLHQQNQTHTQPRYKIFIKIFFIYSVVVVFCALYQFELLV